MAWFDYNAYPAIPGRERWFLRWRAARPESKIPRPMKIHDSRYRPEDVLTLGYLFLVVLGVVLLGGHLENRTSCLLAHLIPLLLILFVVPPGRRSSRAWVRFLAAVYPIFLFTVFYTYANLVNTIVFREPFDAFFKGLDQKIFGVQPSFWLARTHGTPLIHEIVHACYFSYYVTIPFVPLWLYFRAPDRAEFHRCLFTICLTFYASYLTFILLPVHGPNLLRGDDYSGGVVFVPIMDFIYSCAETGGGAFPSSHVAVALVCLLFCLRHSKRLFLAWLFPVLGLTFATVYCRYHYAVDSLAGLLWGCLFFYAGLRMFARATGAGKTT